MLTSKKNIDNITEKSIENQIKKYLVINKIYHYKVHGNGFQRSGIPDIIACINGRFVGIEVKKPGGIVSNLQKINIAEINKSNGVGIVVYSFEEAKQVIDELLNARC